MKSLFESNQFFKTLIYSIFLSTIVIFSGCKKDPTAIDEYYVKFNVNSSTIYSNGKLDVNINNENNQPQSFSIDTKKAWEVTIGPVNKGFSAGVTVGEATNNHGKLTLKGQILVSKNGSPFAVKANDDSGTPRVSMSLSYTLE
jgi:hypothetical protein